MAIKSVNIENLSLLQDAYRRYWSMFNSLSLEHSEFSLNFKVHSIASIRSYQDYSVGQPYHIVLKINFAKGEISVGSYFGNLVAYDEFYKRKDEIEQDINCKIDWTRYTTKGSAYVHKSIDFSENHGWELACNCMIEYAILVKKTFEKYL